MPKMLPAIPQAFGNLKDVFRSANQSLSSSQNALGLPKAKNAMVIMVDGLGWFNIDQFAGHAPFLKKHLIKGSKGYCAFPSTTAASIASLATGVSPSEHGLIGYRVYDRGENLPVNFLTGLDSDTANRYQTADQISDGEASVIVVSKPEYDGSGFSLATFANATFIGESSIDSRFQRAFEEINSGSGKLIYLYIPELDQTAHRFGSKSSKWIQLLEQVDSLTRQHCGELMPSRGVILTADHGVIDVTEHGHILLDECPALADVLADVGGDPRAGFLYLAESVDVNAVTAELSGWLGDEASVYSIPELIDAGIYSTAVLEFSAILPDLVVLPANGRACYHRGFAKPASLAMIGQHGGLTEMEISIPIIKLGAYSSSLLVP